MVDTGLLFLEECERLRSQLTGRRQEPIACTAIGLPKLPNDWCWASLSSACERVSVGHVGPTSEFFCSSDNGVRFARSQDVRPGRLMLEQCAHITPEFNAKLKKSQLRSGDILIVRVGANRGDTCTIPRNIGALNCANIVFARPFFLTGFLSLFLRSPIGQDFLLSLSTGAAQGVLNTQAIAALPVPIPPLRTQYRIASILSAYDDLIENNTRRIAIFEEMARRLYEEWFVHFRFPGHEQVRMVQSELGLIPEGWSVTNASIAIAINPATKIQKYGAKPFVAMNCLSDNSMIISGQGTREGNSGSKFKNGDTLFARITPCLENGKIGFVQFLANEQSVAFGSTEFIVLRSKTLCPEFVYTMARSNPFRDNAIKSMSGATGRQRVREACFDTFKFAHPDVQTLKLFSETANPIFRLINTLSIKNTKLRAQRDLLLPKLISGEIDVSTFSDPEMPAA